MFHLKSQFKQLFYVSGRQMFLCDRYKNLTSFHTFCQFYSKDQYYPMQIQKNKPLL